MDGQQYPRGGIVHMPDRAQLLSCTAMFGHSHTQVGTLLW